MKDALTTSPMPNGLAEVLGDANGEPPDAAAILSHAHRARQAKAAGNRDDWRKSVNELLFSARSSQLKQEQQMFKMQQQHAEKLKKLNETNNELERQINSKAYARQAVDEIKAGNIGTALTMMAVEGVDASAMEQVGEYFEQQAALKANAGDPVAQKMLHTVRALAKQQDSTAAMVMFELFVAPRAKDFLDPKYIGQTKEPNLVEQMLAPVGGSPQEKVIPMGTPTQGTGRQQALTETFSPRLPATPTPTAETQQTLTPVGGGWDDNKMMQWQKYRGTYKPPTASAASQPRKSDDTQFIELAMQHGKSYDEATQLLQSLNAKTGTTGGTGRFSGDAGLLQYLRQEMPEASTQELIEMVKTLKAKAPEAETASSDDTTKMRDFRFVKEGIKQGFIQEGMAEPQAEAKAEKEARDIIYGRNEGVIATGAQRFINDVRSSDVLSEGDKRDIGKVNLYNDKSGIPANLYQLKSNLENIRLTQKNALMPWYRKAHADKTDADFEQAFKQQGFIPGLIKGLKDAGQWTDDARRVLFPEFDGGAFIANMILPDHLERRALEDKISAMNTEYDDKDLLLLNAISQQTLLVIEDIYNFFEAQNKKSSTEQIKQKMLSRLAVMGNFLKVDARTMEEAKYEVARGKLFAGYVKMMSGAAVSEEEARRLEQLFASFRDNPSIAAGKLMGMETDVAREMIAIYGGLFGQKTAEQILELQYYKADKYENSERGIWKRRNIKQFVDAQRRNARWARQSYNDIVDGITSQAEQYFTEGEQWTKTQFTQLRDMVADVRQEKLMYAGNPATMFKTHFGTNARTQLEQSIGDARDPIGLFKAITEWMPVNLKQNAKTIEDAITNHLNLLEKRYLDGLKRTGNFTEEMKKQLNLAKETMKVIKQLEVFAFARETANDFIADLKVKNPGALEDFTEQQLKAIWLDIQKRGF